MSFTIFDSFRQLNNARSWTGAILVLFLFAALRTENVLSQERQEIDQSIRRLMKQENVNGLAVALIENGEPSWVKTFGYRNVAKNLPLTKDTIVYGASLTKTAFAYMVMQLVDEGKLDLDAPITKLLPRPLPDYEDYQDLKGWWDCVIAPVNTRYIVRNLDGWAFFQFTE